MQIISCAQGCSQKAVSQPCDEAGEMTRYFVMMWGAEKGVRRQSNDFLEASFG